MSDPERDLREDILDGFLEEENERGADASNGMSSVHYGHSARDILEALDAADPLRQKGGEVGRLRGLLSRWMANAEVGVVQVTSGPLGRSLLADTRRALERVEEGGA